MHPRTEWPFSPLTLVPAVPSAWCSPLVHHELIDTPPTSLRYSTLRRLAFASTSASGGPLSVQFLHFCFVLSNSCTIPDIPRKERALFHAAGPGRMQAHMGSQGQDSTRRGEVSSGERGAQSGVGSGPPEGESPLLSFPGQTRASICTTSPRVSGTGSAPHRPSAGEGFRQGPGSGSGASLVCSSAGGNRCPSDGEQTDASRRPDGHVVKWRLSSYRRSERSEAEACGTVTFM